MTQSDLNKLVKALYGTMGRNADEDVLAGWTLALHGKSVSSEDFREWCKEVAAGGWKGWAPEPREFLDWRRAKESYGIHPDKVFIEPLREKLRKSRVRRGIDPDEHDPAFLASCPAKLREAIERVKRGARSVPNPFLGKEGEFDFDPFASE